MSNNKVVLAFSGGLDTSFCAVHLTRDKGMEVHAITINTGGFTKEDVKRLGKACNSFGLNHISVWMLQRTIMEKILKYLIFGNVLKNNTYPFR